MIYYTSENGEIHVNATVQYYVVLYTKVMIAELKSQEGDGIQVYFRKHVSSNHTGTMSCSSCVPHQRARIFQLG